MDSETRSALRFASLAGFFYLLVALWSLRALLPDPTALLAISARADATPLSGITIQDQNAVVGTVAFNARTLGEAPSKIWDGAQCFPMDRATTLGEHMLGPSLRSLPIAWMTDNPIAPFNFVLLLDRWLAAMAMYVLAFSLTRNFWASLISGLLFGLHPFRLSDIAHPYAVGNHWTPLALLFAHRLMQRRTWASAVGLTLFVGLQCVEGAYPMLALGAFGAVFGLCLAVQNYARLPALLPKLGAFALAVGLLVWWVLHPYGETSQAWELGRERITLLRPVWTFLPGTNAFPGSTLCLLAACGLVGWARSAFRDTRQFASSHELPYVIATVATFFFVVDRIAIPKLGVEIPPLYSELQKLVPLLGIIRAPAACTFVLYTGLAVLAAYGLKRWLERMGTGTRGWIIALLLSTSLLELFVPSLAARSFGAPLEIVTRPAAPNAADLALYQRVVDGPLLDLPAAEPGSDPWLRTGDYVLASAYHRRRVGGCYTSFNVQIQSDLAQIASQIPDDPRALDQLHAIGFRNLLVRLTSSFLRRSLRARLPEPAIPIGRTKNLALYELRSSDPVSTSLEPLSTPNDEISGELKVPTGGKQELSFPIRNHGSDTYRHPDPILPSPLTIRWLDETGSIVANEELTGLLPLALTAGQSFDRKLQVEVPPSPGTYRAELFARDRTSRIYSRLAVQIDDTGRLQREAGDTSSNPAPVAATDEKSPNRR